MDPWGTRLEIWTMKKTLYFLIFFLLFRENNIQKMKNEWTKEKTGTYFFSFMFEKKCQTPNSAMMVLGNIGNIGKGI